MSNSRVIEVVNKLLENRKIRILSKVILYVTFLLIIGLTIQYVEMNFSHSRTIHEYLKLREIEDGSIRNAFITLSIGVLSIGSIMFTLLIGKIQSLVNEVNYSSFHRKTYVDGKTLDNYVLLMSISIVLIIIYLLAEFSTYPTTYMIILLFAFFTVVYILSTLFTSLLDDLNLFRILEKNYNTTSLKFEDFKKSHTKFKRLLESKEKLITNQRGKRKLQKLEMKMEFLKTSLETLSNKHFIQCIQSIEEINYIIVTACRRKDPELLRTTLEYTEKLIKHHIEILNYNVEDSINFWSRYAFKKSYRFVVYNCLPIYENSELYKSEINLTEIAHNSFTNLLFDHEVLKPGDKEIDDSDFSSIMSKYLNLTINMIKRGFSIEVITYSFSVDNMIGNIKFDSIEKLRQISLNNASLTDELIATSNTKDLSYIFYIQSRIWETVLLTENFKSSHYFAIFYFFESFEKYVNSLDDNTSVDIMSTVFSCLAYDAENSLPQILSTLSTNLNYSLCGVESSKYELILSNNILNLLDKKHKSISKAIRLDESVFFGFAIIANRIMDILRKYVSSQKTTYHIRLMEKSLKQYCDYLLAYNVYDNSRAFNEMEDTFNKLFHDNHVKEIAINAYVNLINKVVTNDIEISVSPLEVNILFQSTINIEGIITQMFYFEKDLYELLLNKIEMNLSKEEYNFLLDHISDLIIGLNAELSNEVNNYETQSEIENSESKRDLDTLISLYMEASQA